MLVEEVATGQPMTPNDALVLPMDRGPHQTGRRVAERVDFSDTKLSQHQKFVRQRSLLRIFLRIEGRGEELSHGVLMQRR